MQAEIEDGGREQKTRFYVYWWSSIFATLMFLLFTFVMMMVPGLFSSEKLWMLSVAGCLLALPLGVGIWKFETTDAPMTRWPFGTVVGVLVGLELIVCVVNFILVALDARVL